MSDSVWHLLLPNRIKKNFFFPGACEEGEGLGNAFVCLWVLGWTPALIYLGRASLRYCFYLSIVKAKKLIVNRTMFLKVAVHTREIECYKWRYLSYLSNGSSDSPFGPSTSHLTSIHPHLPSIYTSIHPSTRQSIFSSIHPSRIHQQIPSDQLTF